MKKTFFIVLITLAFFPTIAQDTIDFPPSNSGSRFCPAQNYPNPRGSAVSTYYSDDPKYRDTYMILWPRVAPRGQDQLIYGVSFPIFPNENHWYGYSGSNNDIMTICPVVKKI